MPGQSAVGDADLDRDEFLPEKDSRCNAAFWYLDFQVLYRFLSLDCHRNQIIRSKIPQTSHPGSDLWETVGMTQTPRLVKVDEGRYKCSACQNFQVIINPHKKLNAGQVRAHIAKREAEHIKKFHSGNPGSV
jgi:hypothetical protein